MNITIKSLAGSGITITAEVNRSDSIATLKEQIWKSKGIPVDHQILIFCGKEMEDDCTFSEYNIQKDSTVHLALRITKDATPEVIVKLMHSMKTMHLSLATMAQSTVIDVKEMLQKEWNILPKDQALIYDGLKLPDEFKLCDCGVTEGCELDLVVSSAHSSVDVQVTMTTSTKQSACFKLSEAMMVRDAKLKIRKKLNVLPCNQRLLCTGKKLKDYCKLSDYTGLPDWPHLQLIAKTTVCITQQNGRSIVLHVVNTTISHIKKKIEKIEGIPYDRQVLVYGGEKLEENKSLGDYGINSFDQLELIQSELMKIHIQIMHSKRFIEYEMRNTDTILDVKKRLQEDTSVTSTILVLISGGVELMDKCLLFDCSEYSEHTTLQLMLPMTNIEFCPSVVLVNVYILSSNETVQLKLGPNDTVGMVKAKIHEQLSIPCDEQKLIYAGRVLEDEYKLFEYSIQKNSTLQLLISNSDPGKLPISPERRCATDPIAEIHDGPPLTMKILLRLNPELVKYIDFVTLLPHMNKYEILTSEERHFLNDDRTQQQKRVSNLLEYLEKKNAETVDDFVRAIGAETSHNGHKELCQLLKKEGIAFL